MSRKFSAARRAAFLRAVAETGNQTLAAERAKVSRSWVTMTRAADPDFDAAVRAALREAQARLRPSPLRPCSGQASPGASGGAKGRISPKVQAGGIWSGSIEPPAGWRTLAGVELVVRGSGGSGGGRRVQIARARVKGWSPRMEQRFLSALAAMCNVKAACAEVGLSPASAYNHRRRHQTFADAWDLAIEIGYDRIEGALIEDACNSLAGVPFDPDAPMPPMSIYEAMHLLHMHKHEVRGIGKMPGIQRRRSDLDEVRASIARKLDAIERWRERKNKTRAGAKFIAHVTRGEARSS
jgi:hypothetical protein